MILLTSTCGKCAPFTVLYTNCTCRIKHQSQKDKQRVKMPLIVENEMYQVQAHPLATGHAPPLNIQSQGLNMCRLQSLMLYTCSWLAIGYSIQGCSARVGSRSQLTVRLHSLLYV